MPRSRARIAGEQNPASQAPPHAAHAPGAAERAAAGAKRGKTSKGPEWLEKEDDFLQYVKDLARALGWKTYHTLRSKGSDAGYPDLVLLRGNLQVIAELKTMKGETTPAQEEWLAAFAAAGAQVYVWRPCDRPEIERVLGASYE